MSELYDDKGFGRKPVNFDRFTVGARVFGYTGDHVDGVMSDYTQQLWNTSGRRNIEWPKTNTPDIEKANNSGFGPELIFGRSIRDYIAMLKKTKPKD